MAQYEFLPYAENGNAAVNANTVTGWPNSMPPFVLITKVDMTEGAVAGTASTTSPAKLTVVSSIPAGGLAAGEIYFDYVNRQYQTGTAFNAGTSLKITGVLRGETLPLS